MNHQEAHEACSLKLDGRLEAEGLNKLETHLSECSECREFCTELERSVKGLERLKTVPPVPSGLLNKLSERIAAAPEPEASRWNWHMPALVFASLAVLLAGGSYLLRERPLPQLPHPGEPEAEESRESAPPFKSVVIFELPDAVAEDITAIESLLYSVSEASPGVIFRGAGSAEVPPLERALASAGLSTIKLTEEAKKILVARHGRLPAVAALKTARSVRETPDGHLSALPGAKLSAEETATLAAENRDRAELIRLYVRQLSQKLGKAEDVIKPALARRYGAVLMKADPAGGRQVK